MMKINVKFPDGSIQQYEEGITPYKIAKGISSGLAKEIITASYNDELVDLDRELHKDGEIFLYKFKDRPAKDVYWHSSSHVMAQAVKRLFPEAKLAIGPAIEKGFYYDFDVKEPFTEKDLENIEAEMEKIVEQNFKIQRKVLSREQAIEMFEQRNEDYKIEMINEMPEQETISIYVQGDFVDLCRGPHLRYTGDVGAFKLLKFSGAYWRGDEKNQMLQRIYGISFPKKKQLKKYLKKLEEAKKRDHRKIGKKLNLFSFHAEGPGFPFWHHNGIVLIDQVTGYLRKTLVERGYREIQTPIILKDELWHRSGHWDNYKDNMYFTEIGDEEFAVKPMNCPGCLLIYNEELHSYREFPLKYSELGLVHRYEKSGVLHGLFRVRQFTQDDAHVFCTPNQLEEEIEKLIDLVYEVYQTFGFEDFFIELSTKPEKAIGCNEVWEKAEKALANALDKKNISHKVNQGEGAFYGPKIDFHIKDSLDRLWQCGTIQVDFSMPERFDLEYIGADGEKHRPVMIHRAILGSIERFIGILIEHYAGNFPLWLAPVQVEIIPISEQHLEYAEKILAKLKDNEIRAEVDYQDEKVGYKIREAEKQKIPYMIIVGDNEIENENISVRKHQEGDQGSAEIKNFVKKLKTKIENKE
ncbi:MAG: threonine--tRNA ligase [Candidatus Cloacimonetes bacterium]|nr:threonine--tRNA ligase [Candidatus Cloacimonadota bacterium]